MSENKFSILAQHKDTSAGIKKKKKKKGKKKGDDLWGILAHDSPDNSFQNDSLRTISPQTTSTQSTPRRDSPTTFNSNVMTNLSIVTDNKMKKREGGAFEIYQAPNMSRKGSHDSLSGMNNSTLKSPLTGSPRVLKDFTKNTWFDGVTPKDSPKPQRVTPLSPASYSLGNITSVDALKSKLEDESLKNESNYRITLWREWTNMLHSSSLHYFDGFSFISFKQVFLTSQTLENIVKSILRSPHSSEDDVILYELFRSCFIGEDQQLYHLITLMRGIGESLSNGKNHLYHKNIAQVIINIVGKLKLNQSDAMHNSLYTSLNALENKIYEAEKNSFSSDASQTKILVDLYSQKINSLMKNFKRKSVDDLDKFFGTTDMAIRDSFKESNGNRVFDLSKLEEEKSRNFSKYDQGIMILTQQIENVTHQENDLQHLLDQLEDKIREVKKEIVEKRDLHARLENDRKELTKSWTSFKDQYNSARERLKGVDSDRLDDFDIFQRVNEFLNVSKTTIYESVQKLQSNVENMFNKSSISYLEQAEAHLKNLNVDLSSLTFGILEKTMRDILVSVSEYVGKSTPEGKELIFTQYQQFDLNFRIGAKIISEAFLLSQDLDIYGNSPDFLISYEKGKKQIEKMSNTQQAILLFKDRVVKMVQEVHLDYPESPRGSPKPTPSQTPPPREEEILPSPRQPTPSRFEKKPEPRDPLLDPPSDLVTKVEPEALPPLFGDSPKKQKTPKNEKAKVTGRKEERKQKLDRNQN